MKLLKSKETHLREKKGADTQHAVIFLFLGIDTKQWTNIFSVVNYGQNYRYGEIYCACIRCFFPGVDSTFQSQTFLHVHHNSSWRARGEKTSLSFQQGEDSPDWYSPV